MFATGKNVSILQNEKPLTLEEEATLRQAFRAKYLQQIRMWYLVQKPNKKRKLLQFLNLYKNHATPSRPRTSMTRIKSGELVLRSSTGTVDLGVAFFARPCSRKNNRERFASNGIKGEDIFGSTQAKPVLERSSTHESLAQFVLKTLLNDDSAQKLLPYAEENYGLLNELQEWVDKKCNATPVQLFKEPDSITPNKERLVNSQTIREDHLGSIHQERIKGREPFRQKQWHPPVTAYTDFFYDQGRASIDPPFYPSELQYPFSRFPSKPSEIDRKVTFSNQQAIENTQAGRKYRSIFESKTIL